MTTPATPASTLPMTGLDPASVNHLVLASDLAESVRLQDRIEAELVECGYDHADVFRIRLALEEALANAIKHGNQLDPQKSVQVAYAVTAGLFAITVTDEGPGFDPTDLPDPTAPENLERQCGRGVFLIRSFMTEVRYNDRGNSVTMTKVRPPA